MKPTRLISPSGEWLEQRYATNTAQDIARELHVSIPTVLRWLRAANITLRSASETAKLVASRRSYEELLILTAKSRAKITGKKRSHADLCKRARGKQRTAKMSAYEIALFKALGSLGLSPIPLFAVDKFNLDLAFPDIKLAIEVDGGNWHKTARIKKAQDTSKAVLLASLGWRIIRVTTRRKDWLTPAIDSIIPALRLLQEKS